MLTQSGNDEAYRSSDDPRVYHGTYKTWSEVRNVLLTHVREDDQPIWVWNKKAISEKTGQEGRILIVYAKRFLPSGAILMRHVATRNGKSPWLYDSNAILPEKEIKVIPKIQALFGISPMIIHQLVEALDQVRRADIKRDEELMMQRAVLDAGGIVGTTTEVTETGALERKIVDVSNKEESNDEGNGSEKQ